MSDTVHCLRAGLFERVCRIFWELGLFSSSGNWSLLCGHFFVEARDYHTLVNLLTSALEPVDGPYNRNNMEDTRTSEVRETLSPRNLVSENNVRCTRICFALYDRMWYRCLSFSGNPLNNNFVGAVRRALAERGFSCRTLLRCDTSRPTSHLADPQSALN